MRKVLYLLGHLSDSDLEWMITRGSKRRVPAGTVLIQEGHGIDTLYVLLDGALEVTGPQIGDKPLRLKSGEVVGEVSLLDSRPPTATVTATNGAGYTTTTTLVTIEEAIAGLSATNDSPGELGETTTLTATIRAGTNVTYAWDLGDGTAATGPTVTHRYQAVGDYTVEVTVGNVVNAVTATTTVQITPMYLYLPQMWN